MSISLTTGNLDVEPHSSKPCIHSRGHSGAGAAVLFVLQVDRSDPVGEADDEERGERDVGLDDADGREEDFRGPLDRRPHPTTAEALK